MAADGFQFAFTPDVEAETAPDARLFRHCLGIELRE